MKNNIIVLAFVVLLAAACAEQPMLPAPLDLPKKVLEYSTMQGAAQSDVAPVTEVTETPKPPAATKLDSVRDRVPQTSGAAEVANITLAFEQIPLPSFIQAVYGATLKKNINIDPAVVARQDLVTIRTGAPQTPTQVAAAVRLLLKSYGIAVVDLGGLVRVVPDNANLGYLPEIRRGRALPETPLPLRPIFHLVEFQSVRNTDIASWIRVMFGEKVSLQEDASRNAVLLGGQLENVTAAIEAIHVLDQPLMRGRQSARITPAYMSADELSRKLTEILSAEGYSAGPPTGITTPISLVSIPSVNALIVFAADKAIVDHVVQWARDLDKPGAKGIGRSFFSYQVQYIDAQALAATLEKILSGSAPVVAKPAGTLAAAAAAAGPARVVVDQASNTIIFQGSTEDYGQIRSLLELLDKPSKQALIEVTVAEVKLDGILNFGVEWVLKNAGIGGLAAAATTTLGAGGVTYTRLGTSDARVVLNALATNTRATILSSPRVLARNGETATIQVVDEVPILTSTASTPLAGTTITTSNTIQYRSAGVILKVRPVIHSGNQVDLDLSQEVSSPQATTTAGISSPTFSTKRIDTKLSMKDGATVLLGGLISSDGSQSVNGIPLLKDIPGLGALFGSNETNNHRRELIILITPYIISNDNDAQLVTDAFKKQLGPWAKTMELPKPSPPIVEGAAKSPVVRTTENKVVPVPAVPADQGERKALEAADSNNRRDTVTTDVKPGSNNDQQK
jgi:general secretion pathway protein D